MFLLMVVRSPWTEVKLKMHCQTCHLVVFSIPLISIKSWNIIIEYQFHHYRWPPMVKIMFWIMTQTKVTPTVSWPCFFYAVCQHFLLQNLYFFCSPLSFLHGVVTYDVVLLKTSIFVSLTNMFVSRKHLCVTVCANCPGAQTDFFAARAYPCNMTPKSELKRVTSTRPLLCHSAMQINHTDKLPVFQKKWKPSLKRLEGGLIRLSLSRPFSRLAPQRHHNWKLSVCCGIIKWWLLNSNETSDAY